MATKPRTNSRTHLLSVRYPLWMAEQLRTISAKTGRSLTDLICDAVSQYLHQYDLEHFGIIDDITEEGGTED